MGSVGVQNWISIHCQSKSAGRMNLFDFYLCVTWVPRKLDMVSSRFCRRSAMFLTVRNRLVSGSSPEWDKNETSSEILSSTTRYNSSILHRDRPWTVSDHPPERSSMESWLVLVKETSPLIPPEPVSVFAVPSASVWDLGKQIVWWIKGGDIIDSELLCI